MGPFWAGGFLRVGFVGEVGGGSGRARGFRGCGCGWLGKGVNSGGRGVVKGEGFFFGGSGLR